MQRHAPTSRPKAGPPEEPEATSELKLGEMQDSEALTVSEAALVLNALLAKRKKDRKTSNNNE
jgi:DNA-directed RNA polymerase II subunit RPB4